MKLKPEKGERGRGRGRGKGKGRGRGRGQSSKDANEQGKKSKKPAPRDPNHESEWGWWGNTWYDEHGYPIDQWTCEKHGVYSDHAWDGYVWWDGQESIQKLSQQKSKVETPDTTEEPANKRKRNAATRDRKDDVTPAAASTKTPAPKRKKKTEETPAEVPKTPPKRMRGKQKEVVEPPKSEVDQKDIEKELQEFIEPYKISTCTEISDALKEELKGKLHTDSYKSCRLNIYWKKPACGTHAYSEKKDVANFYFQNAEHGYAVRLALALKCADMFVTWAHDLCCFLLPC